MKHLTRFFALVLALTLAFSLCLPAFAFGTNRPDPEKPFDNSAFFDYKDRGQYAFFKVWFIQRRKNSYGTCF